MCCRKSYPAKNYPSQDLHNPGCEKVYIRAYISTNARIWQFVFFMGYETLGKFHTYETGYETGVWNKGMKHRYETRMKHAHEISGRSKDVKQLHCGDNTFNFKAWYALILAEKKKRWQPLQQKYPQKKILLGAAQIEWYETCMKQVWNLVWNFRTYFFLGG